MTSTLIIQLAISFIVGGCFITFLSLIAERANENIAGIILMFPSTMVLGFFFLGLTTSAEKVAFIIPATLIPLGIVIFSSVIYIYCSMFFSNYFKSKIGQILTTFIASSLIWFILASPFAIWKFTNLAIGTIGFFILIVITQFILNKNRLLEEIARPNYTKLQIIIRAIYHKMIKYLFHYSTFPSDLQSVGWEKGINFINLSDNWK